MKYIGFIGCGNMSQAIMGGVLRAGLVDKDKIIASDIFAPNRELCKTKFSINVSPDNKLVAREADILFLAVKPDIYPIVIEEIKDIIKKDCVVISIAAGQNLAKLEKQFNPKTKIVVTMPNTPAMVNEGMTAAVVNQYINDEEKIELEKILSSIGQLEFVSEAMLAAVTAVSGSSPAYVYMMIEAMADAAVLGGLPRAQAYKFAAQAVLGSAKMVLETGIHPGVLKDNVCSPGGTTIEAVTELERTGFRSSIISAMKLCMDKFKEMSQ